MFSILLLLGSVPITLQQTTTIGETNPTTVEDTLPTTFPAFTGKTREGSSCKNQFVCPSQRKPAYSKGFHSVPSKNLVPPYTDSEEEELRTTEGPRTTITDAETETVPLTTLISKTSRRSSITPILVKKRDNQIRPATAEATNELKNYLPPEKYSPAAAQVDLSYLPPQGVLPAAAAASLDIARVNFEPPEISPSPAQTDARQIKSDHPKDLCADAFHSFLCTPLKSRKRITGALPNSLVPVRTFNPSASNTVQNAITPAKPSNPTTLPPSTTRPTPVYAPLPSNVDRSYLPPSQKSIAASPSFNSITVAKTTEKPTTKKPFTSTPRPFIQTSIIPFIAPKVIEQINILPITTTKRLTTTTEKVRTTTPIPRLSPEPSNEISRGYLPPVTTTRPFSQQSAILPNFRQKTKPPSVQIITEQTKRISFAKPTPAAYLPPVQKFDAAGAAQFNEAVAPAAPAAAVAQQREHHDHHDHHHHGKDICSDPFHSFLCAPLKQRKRITGALPPGFNPQSSNRKETKLRPEPALKPANTFQLEVKVKPTEVVPAANAPSSQSVGYQYPKPSPAFPLPSQTSTDLISPTSLRPTTARPTTPRPTTPRTTTAPVTGYQYPKPSIPFPLPSQQNVEVIPKEDRLSPSFATPQGYQYPKPSPAFPLPSQTSTDLISPTSLRPTTARPTTPRPTTPRTTTAPVTGYQYPKPSIPFPLPSQQNVEVIPKEDRLSPSFATPQGYQYPKPSIPFPLPSQQQQQKLAPALSKPQPSPTTLATTTAKPIQPQSSDRRTGYQYPKPAQSFPLPTGYQYPKPANPLQLPTESKSGFSNAKSSLSALRNLGSAEFIPVNKIDAKRQVESGLTGASPKFGERIRSRVRQSRLVRSL